MSPQHGDLAILSAEKYDDGILTTKGIRRIRQSTPSTDDGGGRPVKKRAKTAGTTTHGAKAGNSGEENGGDNAADEKKRVRGRPRLDTNDESALERRRTQIRLAQRAYRNRKETAISTLEQQVKDLRDTNEEMSNAFMALHDFAIGKGLLDQAPEFGTKLKFTTEKFLVLARKAAEAGLLDMDDEQKLQQTGLQEHIENVAGGRQGGHTGKSRTPPHSNMGSISSHSLSPPHPHHPEQLLGGLIVTQEPIMQPNTQQILAALPPGFLDPSVMPPEYLGVGSAGSHMIPTTVGMPLGLPSAAAAAAEYEVITQPTMENASFPYLYTDAQLQALLNPSPLPNFNTTAMRTYSHKEATFGRRLQRFALERALTLISLPNPPPLRLIRVFGFVLPFETPEKIRERLQAGLARGTQESLSFWQAPFHHVGGAGTHFPTSASLSPADDDGQHPQRRMGNQGTRDVNRRVGSGLSTGPWHKEVEFTRDNHMDRRQRITVPGFEGDFYDPDEVEMFLHRMGVDIEPGQDYVTVEVNIDAFVKSEDSSPATEILPNHPSSSTSPPSSTSSGAGGGGVEAVQWPSAPPGMPGLFPGPGFMAPMLSPGAVGADGGVSTQPGDSLGALGAFLPEDTQAQPLPAYVGHGGFAGAVAFPQDGMGMPHQQHQQHQQQQHQQHHMHHQHHGGHDGSVSPPQKTLMMLDVTLFITKLTDQAICLGRNPGFRLENVRKAFLEASQRAQLAGM